MELIEFIELKIGQKFFFYFKFALSNVCFLFLFLERMPIDNSIRCEFSPQPD